MWTLKLLKAAMYTKRAKYTKSLAQRKMFMLQVIKKGRFKFSLNAAFIP